MRAIIPLKKENFSLRPASTIPDTRSVLCSDHSLSNGSSDPEGTAHIFIPWRHPMPKPCPGGLCKKGPPFLTSKESRDAALLGKTRAPSPSLRSVGRREGSRDASPQGVFPPHMSPEKRILSLFALTRELCEANSQHEKTPARLSRGSDFIRFSALPPGPSSRRCARG